MSGTITTDLKEEIRQALLPRRLELIQQHGEWIRRHEDRVLQHVIDGDQLRGLQDQPVYSRSARQSGITPFGGTFDITALYRIRSMLAAASAF